MSARTPALTALLARHDIAPGSDKHGTPTCAREECHRFDGKRCEVLGHRPDIMCEPAVRAIIRELDQQPEQIAAWLDRCGCPAIAEDVRAGRWKERDRG